MSQTDKPKGLPILRTLSGLLFVASGVVALSGGGARYVWGAALFAIAALVLSI